MAVPFSQIPHAVLKRVREPVDELPPPIVERKKLVKFHDEKDEPSGKSRKPLKSVLKVRNEDTSNPDSTTSKKETSDAIVQTDQPEYISRSVQTIESFFQMESLYEQFKSNMKSDSMITFKPMYYLNSTTDMKPPLKIGLMRPRGTKRKVFYPDDE